MPLAVFDVKHYGAADDGATDDTAAIQRAVAAATTVGGGIVYFPRGTYVCGPSVETPLNGKKAPS